MAESAVQFLESLGSLEFDFTAMSASGTLHTDVVTAMKAHPGVYCCWRCLSHGCSRVCVCGWLVWRECGVVVVCDVWWWWWWCWCVYVFTSVGLRVCGSVFSSVFTICLGCVRVINDWFSVCPFPLLLSRGLPFPIRVPGAGNAALQLNSIRALITMATSEDQVKRIIAAGVVPCLVANLTAKVRSDGCSCFESVRLCAFFCGAVCVGQWCLWG